MERRDELLRLLRRRGDWTVDDLAHTLEVSRRTVLRDINLLRERDFDITGMCGPGGGVHLEATSVAITSHLDADEVVALILAVAVSESMSWIPFAASAQSALAKIEAALPAQRVVELQRVMQRVLVDEAPPFKPEHDYKIDPDLVTIFERAFTANLLLAFNYTDRYGNRTRRRVEPHGLLVRAPLWYIMAWDPRRHGPRLFRADRMRRPKVTDETFVPRPHELVTAVCPHANTVVPPLIGVI